MILYPSIDILDGKVIRLRQGDFKNLEVYNDSPLDQAKQFYDQGAKWIHVVDLDKVTGKGDNTELICEINKTVDVNLQIGGGIRTIEQMSDWLEAKAARIVIGTLALKEVEAISKFANKYPGQVAIALDARDETVSVSGWTQDSKYSIYEVIDWYKDEGIAAFIYTDILKDGTLTKPNFDMANKIANYSSVPIVLSGGVRDMEDIKQLHAAKNVAGVICGKAIYVGNVDLKEAYNLLAAN